MLIGRLANAGLPPFAGFFSKDTIIDAVRLSHVPGAAFGYWSLLLGAFIGGLYTFRLIFYAFHGECRVDKHALEHLHESPWVVTVPLVLLAIPSIGAGWWLGKIVFGGFFGSAIEVLPAHGAIAEMAGEYRGLWSFMLHGMAGPAFWLALAGLAITWYLYTVRTDLPKRIAIAFGPVYAIVEGKYGFDELYAWLFAGGTRALGTGLWRAGDQTVIDGLMVNGSARVVGWFASVVRLFQSGLIYQYAISMLIGVVVLTYWFLRS
jgi:NADH-quinone oxidoreductase subunit L